MRFAIIEVSKGDSVYKIPTIEMLEVSLKVFFEKRDWSVDEIAIVAADNTILIGLSSASDEDNIHKVLQEFLSLFDGIAWWIESDEKDALMQEFPDLTFNEHDYPKMFFEGLGLAFSAPTSENNDTILQQHILRTEFSRTEKKAEECRKNIESALDDMKSLLN